MRERRDDIPLLVHHFIEKGNQREGKAVKRADSQAMKRIIEHPWMGNVRELENAIEHAFVLCEGDEIRLRDLPVEIRDPGQLECYGTPASAARPSPSPRQNVTREELVRLLEECHWNKAEVARRIDRSRTAVWKYMKKWGIPLQQP